MNLNATAQASARPIKRTPTAPFASIWGSKRRAFSVVAASRASRALNDWRGLHPIAHPTATARAALARRGA